MSAPAPSPSSEPDPAKAVAALSPAGLVIGLLAVVATCVVVCYAELVIYKIQIGFLQLPPAVVGMLVLILLIQAGVSRLSGRLRLEPRELLTVYVMMLLTSMICSRGLLQKLIPLLVASNYSANETNGWQGLLFRNTPRWAVPWNPAGGAKQPVAARFYDGLRPGEHIPWALWYGPLAAWAVFVALVFGAFLCLGAIIRRQWVDNEKLTFPLVQLPLELIRGDAPSGQPPLLRNRLTWLGFAVPAFVFGFNGLHQWYPSVPEIVIDVPFQPYFTSPPWDALGGLHMWLSFMAIGFFYLLPTDLLFSVWFFFVLFKAGDVAFSAFGYQLQSIPYYMPNQYVGYQVIGCYFAMVGFMFYAARPHLATVWRAATAGLIGRGDARAAGRDELLPYGVAFWGLVACVLLSAGWLYLLGMAYWLALLELGILFFVTALVMARSTCESGMLMTETSFRPIDVYRMFGDVRLLGGANLTALAFLDAMWMRDQRGLVLTGFLDSMKLADGVRVRRRSLLGVFALGMTVAVLFGGYLHLLLPYRNGAVNMYWYVYQGNPNWMFTDAVTEMNRLRPPLPWLCTLNFVLGLLVTVALVAMRARMMWFPLHPLGYALCATWTVHVFWFSCLLAWLVKVVILRYGGMRLYVRARPFFLGMVLGEFTMAVLWTVPSLIWHTPTPTFPWS